jgi:hypothetical protein
MLRWMAWLLGGALALITIRRAAVLAVELRSRKVDVRTAPAELAASAIRTPYSGEPFAWDADALAIVFVGLEPGERGRHAFDY